MPRRRRRGRSSTVDLLPLAALAVVVVVVLWVLRELSLHPIALVAVALALAAGGALWFRHRHHQWQLAVARSQEIARYHVMGPKDFEHALALLCRRDGCTHVRVVGGAGDLGADVIALAPDGRRIVLQAKRYGPTSTVRGPDLQKFGGTCYAVHGADIAAVVTTSRFTRQAEDYATHMGIRLLDEHGLAAWASRTGPAPWH